MRKSLLFICLGTLVIMSLTMASYFVLTRFYPTDEIRRMTLSMSRLHSVTESSGFHWTMTDDGEDIFTTLYLTGPILLGDLTKVEHDTTFRSVFLSKSNQYKDLSGEIRNKEGKVYLTYASPGPNVDGVDFSKQGTWISFEPGEFPSWGSLIPNLKIPFKFSSSQTSWTPEGIKRLRLLLALTDVFQVKYDGAEESVAGEKTRVIDARFDTDALKSFLFDVVRAKEERDPTDEERINIATIATGLQAVSVRLWIGKKDHLLYRMQVIGGIPKENTTTLTPMDIRIDFTDFNKATEVVTPDVSLSFATLYQSLLHTLPGSAVSGRAAVIPTFTQDAVLPQQIVQIASDPDHDGLSNPLELFFGTDSDNADTDSDGVNDGDEIKRGTNPRGKGSLFGFGLGN